MCWGVFKQKLISLRVKYFVHVLLDCNLFEINIGYGFLNINLLQQPSVQLTVTLSHNGAFKIPVVVLLCGVIVSGSLFYSDQDNATKLLLDAGADINYKNAVGTFPLELSTTLGNYKVLRLLAKHPRVNLHNQVCLGPH